MAKSSYALISSRGTIIPQSLETEEAGMVLSTMLKDKAIVLPFICKAKSSKEALTLYHEKIQQNLHIFELFLGKESFDVS